MNLEDWNLIDEVKEISPDGMQIITASNVVSGGSILEHHFPGFHVLPGVFLAELIAQSAGYLTFITSSPSLMSFFLGIDKARFYDFVKPDCRLITECELTHRGSGFNVFEGIVKVDDRKVAKAEIRLKTTEFPNETLRLAMEEKIGKVQ